jgi:segregation and condensation protein B
MEAEASGRSGTRGRGDAVRRRGADDGEEISAHLGGLELADVRDALARIAAPMPCAACIWSSAASAGISRPRPILAHLLRREKEQVRRLSRAATEVLAIVAYHEPVSRAEIEAIRGVQTSAGTLDVLMEAGWVRVAGGAKCRAGR